MGLVGGLIFFTLGQDKSSYLMFCAGCLSHRCCGLQAIKYCANSPLARIGAQVPAWLAVMADKQSLLPAKAVRID
jgi:hypothetical protein